ncbi:hypothetical protein C9374_014195 [Naegleria lovaniensis]|uniref:Uncharacterized protein n=1 Tax=Naegleria lovaniensis TaxID=51637 RepID=A0AA88KN39_NAELO|nr:uncharacterized protein C9374_014195 [Naegleria lovaniensis]KAG2389635.1 hypothetical protein C9374_014195 [Naegleria lovaniensis]
MSLVPHFCVALFHHRNKTTHKITAHNNQQPISDPITTQIQQQRREETSSYDFKDIIIEHGLPRIEPLNYSYFDLCEEEQDYVARSFQLFAKCARVKINRMLKLGGIHRRTSISCGCIETETFQLMFQNMKGATFFHSDRMIYRHGIKYKVPCVGYRFKDTLPVLDLFENWGRQVVKSCISQEDNSVVTTEYLLQVKNISFILETESSEVFMHMSYDTKIKYDDDDEFTFF